MRRWDLALAGLVAVAGLAMTTIGALSHQALLIAPGSALTLLGGAAVGTSLAVRDVRLFPRPGTRDAAATPERP